MHAFIKAFNSDRNLTELPVLWSDELRGKGFMKKDYNSELWSEITFILLKIDFRVAIKLYG